MEKSKNTKVKYIFRRDRIIILGFRLFRRLAVLNFCFATLIFIETGQAEDIARIVVTVNDQVITNRDLDDYCKILEVIPVDERGKLSCRNEEYKRAALSRLIEDKLILDEAKREEIRIPHSWIDDKLNNMISVYPSREDFEKSLLKRDLTVTRVKEKIKEQYLTRTVIDRYVKSFIGVSPQAISSYYLTNREKFYSSAKYIFYIAKSKQKDDLEKIAYLIKEKGIVRVQESYRSILSKIESTDSELREEISKIFKGLAVGGYKIEKSGGIYYLIYLEELFPPRQLTLSEAKEQVYSHLWTEEFRKRFNEWVEELKKKAVIKVYYE
ncbi:MAG: SurA N-terminal domain-containing protein [Omnitrophica bacterium]|nr:SurA N-terminal domain-containing protein [Candidatus Omnitrophota bacterium]